MAVTVLGCATLGGRGAEQCPGGEAVWSRPDRLLAQANEELRQEKDELAYRCLALVRKRHPDSPERVEAFRLAAFVYRREYLRNRLTDPDAPWFGVERAFMLDWLDSFAAGDAFPQEQADQLLLRMPYDFGQGFLAYAATGANLSRWSIKIKYDDGFVRLVNAQSRAA